jgi:hypothetical protein
MPLLGEHSADAPHLGQRIGMLLIVVCSVIAYPSVLSLIVLLGLGEIANQRGGQRDNQNS